MMKKTIAVLMVVGAVISGNNIYATGNNSNPSGKPAKTKQVSFDNVNTDSKLYIKDSKDRILYSENIESGGNYSRRFDFSSLPSNDYYFEVEKEAFISIRPFTVQDDQVVFHEDLKTEILKPRLMLVNNRVVLLRNLDEEQSLNVKIYYQGEKLVFSEIIKNDSEIGRIYNMSDSNSGDYLFSIEYDGYNHREFLSINTLD